MHQGLANYGNISSLKILWESLDSRYNCRFLLTSRLNQDCLENHFSQIRSRGGFRDNPDPIQFRAAFKQVAVKNLLVPPKSGNCEKEIKNKVTEINDLSRCSVTKFSAKQTATTYGFMTVDVPVAPTNAVCATSVPPTVADTVLCDEVLSNGLTYVTGYVCRKVLAKYVCGWCKNVMLCSEVHDNAKSDIFGAMKAYSNRKGIFGGSLAPS